MRKSAVLFIAAFAGTTACASADVSHRGQVMSLRSSHSSDSFSSDALHSTYYIVEYKAPHAGVAPSTSLLPASLVIDCEADTSILSERTSSKKVPLRLHKLSRTVELD
jgi:hypothetical protein